ncbi:Lactoylglutathione lyase [hydrothermal vent metagenome]|uniref:Lactoylglutathione lyase n=1 Tax=hydrothermal vent metagenome TaxID=652676 RepID=A0A3B0TDT8_9ZZZZ
MKLKYTILYVDNVKDSLDFYQSAFGLKAKMLHESGDYGELDTGATTLSFSSRALMTQLGKSPARANAAAPVFEIALETDDVAAALKKALNAGAKLVQEAEKMPWGQTTAYVADKDGYLVEICTPVTGQP